MTDDHFFSFDPQKTIDEIGEKRLSQALEQMLLIREFEKRAEAAYQQGKMGGFFHSYTGQEAIQTAAVMAIGEKNWWITSYRCHALALLLGATPNELMAELYGRITGNAKGRGGSMHFFTKRLLGGYGIVGGHIPIATGAAFTSKYLGNRGEVTVCFMGDGAVAQGAFHEALNLASLWSLPCMFVIENNLWGMGTAVKRALAVERIAADKAPGYQMSSYTFDGTDFLQCFAGFKKAYEEVIETNRPVLIEAVAERFKGHSISDPGLYRSKEQLQIAKENDPIERLFLILHQFGKDRAALSQIERGQKERILSAMEYAEQSPWPDPNGLEKEVYAPCS